MNVEGWYFVTKIVLTYCEEKFFYSDQEKHLKFEAEGQEQSIQTVKSQSNFW